MKNRNTSNTWLYVSVAAVIVLVVLEVISDKLIGSATVSTETYAPFAGMVSLGAVFAIVISAIAVFKTKSWLRLLPIIGMLVSLVIFGLAFFAYGFSGYGS